jgi:hypothetical protein
MKSKSIKERMEELAIITNEANNPDNAYTSSYMLGIADGLLQAFNLIYNTNRPKLELPEKFKMVLDVDRKVIIEELGNEAKELIANIALMSMTDDSVRH